MKKILFFVILRLTAIELALCMQCYVTNIQALEKGDSITPEPEDCDGYMQKTVRAYGIEMKQEILQNSNTSCFSTKIKVKPGAPMKSLVIKGCVPQGACNIVTDTIQSEITRRKMAEYVAAIDCSECTKDKCNK